MSRTASPWYFRIAGIRERVQAQNEVSGNCKRGRDTSPAGRIARTIIDAHALLTTLTELKPGEPVNSILGQLVGTCCEIHSSKITAEILSNAQLQNILPSLRSICAKAEFLLEIQWAEYIGSASDDVEAASRLKQFPYHQNYIDLTRMEVAALLAATNAMPRRIAFIGSGPLPLSSLFMLDVMSQWHRSHFSSQRFEGSANTTATVLNIDHSRTAIDTSSLMISKLRASQETDSGVDVNDLDLDITSHGDMSFLCQGASATDLSVFDTVFLAALVGETQSEKESLILQVVSKMVPGSMLVVRTSWGLRTCLYPEVDLTTEALGPRLKVCSVVHPYNKTINSIIIAEVR